MTTTFCPVCGRHPGALAGRFIAGACSSACARRVQVCVQGCDRCGRHVPLARVVLPDLDGRGDDVQDWCNACRDTVGVIPCPLQETTHD